MNMYEVKSGGFESNLCISTLMLEKNVYKHSVPLYPLKPSIIKTGCNLPFLERRGFWKKNIFLRLFYINKHLAKKMLQESPGLGYIFWGY